MEQLNGTVTDAGAAYINQKIVAGQPVTIDHFLLAYVPGIDETTAADPAITAVPATATFSQAEPIHKLAYNGDNAVTYSLMLAASAGDFDFNWYGIVTDTGVLLAFAHIPEVKKRANIGQVINRNFVVPFTNAKALTGAQVPVESWQFDNTIHLNRIDADVRAVNQEMYGHATFFADAGLVTASGADYHVAPGNAVIGGFQITVPETTLPAAVGDVIQCAVTWAVDNQGNYSADITVFADPVEAAPVAGDTYTVTLSSISAGQAITDQRQVLPHAVDTALELQALKPVVDSKAPLASPALTGNPTAPTQPAGTNNTRIANTAFVVKAINDMINGAPGALDTLNELAAAMGDDPNFAATVTNELANKVDQSDPRLSDAREWLAATVGQAEAEAGEATTRRAWTAQRVHQSSEAAISARADLYRIRGTITTEDFFVPRAPGLYKVQNGSGTPNPNRPPITAWGMSNLFGLLKVDVSEVGGEERVVLEFMSTSNQGFTVSSNGGTWQQWQPTNDASYLLRTPMVQGDGGYGNFVNDAMYYAVTSKDFDLLTFRTPGLNINNDASDWANAPISGWLYVEVFVHANPTNLSWVTQRVTTMGTIGIAGRMFIRSCVSGVWTGWREITQSYGAADWAGGNTKNEASGMLVWRNYGNSHVIFDASSALSPSQIPVDRKDPAVPWSDSLPTLMGWNGVETFGVRVDSSKRADQVAGIVPFQDASGVLTAESGQLSNTVSQLLQAPTADDIRQVIGAAAEVTIDQLYYDSVGSWSGTKSLSASYNDYDLLIVASKHYLGFGGDSYFDYTTIPSYHWGQGWKTKVMGYGTDLLLVQKGATNTEFSLHATDAAGSLRIHSVFGVKW